MTSLLRNLAVATTLGDTAAPLVIGRVDLSTLIERVVGRHRPIARASQVEVDFAVLESAVTVHTDATLLEQVLSNLVDNAIRCNRPEGHVHHTSAIPACARAKPASSTRACSWKSRLFRSLARHRRRAEAEARHAQGFGAQEAPVGGLAAGLQALCFERQITLGDALRQRGEHAAKQAFVLESQGCPAAGGCRLHRVTSKRP